MVGLEVNLEKRQSIVLTRYENAGQNRDIETANRSFENVSQITSLKTTVRNQILNQEKIRRRFNSGSVCYRSVHKLLASHLLSKT
jgi:hypothetical protein